VTATPVGLVIGQLCHGGAERQLYELVRGLDQSRFRPIVYCLSDVVAPYGPLVEQAGATLRVLPRAGHMETRRLRLLARRFRQDGVRLVHAFLFQANAYTWIARRLAGVPHLITSVRNCQGVGRVRDWANRFAFRASDAIVCNGEAVRTFLRQHYGAPPGRCVVIYNGVDLGRFAPPAPADADPAPGNGARSPLVVTVARLVPQKDLALFVEAAARLRQAHPTARFAVVGDGPSRPELAALASARGLDGALEFLGARADVPDVLRAADVFWLTSAVEGLPNVVLEAAACGLPVVARDVGACREIVRHGATGYLVSARDPEPFVRYTLPLLQDPSRARAMGRTGRAVAEEQFSLTQMVRATERLYAAALGTPSPAVAVAARG
jgi:glycosyltransferase involved in cell wall biosynthesis